MVNLLDALARVRAFRSVWNDGDEMDEESHLTTADLDVILAAADSSGEADSGGALPENNLGSFT